MVYKNDFIVVLKSKGKILREQGGFVKLPFGSEYSILLKNIGTEKAVANIKIDGADVLDGHSLIVGSNEETELEGFMKNLSARNKFKFIKKTKEISDYRGDRIDDGIIRVEFQFEKKIPKLDWWTYVNNNDPITPTKCYWSSEFSFGSTNEPIIGATTYYCNSNLNCSIEDGITVKGSQIDQNFIIGSVGVLEDTKHVINLMLRGYNSSGKIVRSAITIKTKLVCETCGKKSKSNAKFCNRCGTYLD